MNFWGYIIEGLTQILGGVLSPLPNALVNPILANAAVIAFYGIAPVLFFVGPFINLSLFVGIITAIIALEIVRATVGVWRFILKLIPMAG
jgi:hypothetical protein